MLRTLSDRDRGNLLLLISVSSNLGLSCCWLGLRLIKRPTAPGKVKKNVTLSWLLIHGVKATKHSSKKLLKIPPERLVRHTLSVWTLPNPRFWKKVLFKAILLRKITFYIGSMTLLKFGQLKGSQETLKDKQTKSKTETAFTVMLLSRNMPLTTINLSCNLMFTPVSKQQGFHFSCHWNRFGNYLQVSQYKLNEKSITSFWGWFNLLSSSSSICMVALLFAAQILFTAGGVWASSMQ